VLRPLILLTLSFASMAGCKPRQESGLLSTSSKEPKQQLAPVVPAGPNWCFPSANFDDVPAGTPYMAIICESESCGGSGAILSLDATCTPVVKLDAESRAQFGKTGDDYEYELAGKVSASYTHGKVLDCTEAMQILDTNYAGNAAGVSCRILNNTRLEGQHTLSIIKEAPATAFSHSVTTDAVPGSRIARDLTTIEEDGNTLTDLLNDMDNVIRGYKDQFQVQSSETGGCLRNSRIANNTDIQAHMYCRIPHHARRCFGGLINEYKMHCPRTRLPTDQRPWVKTYAPDIKKAFETCFIGTDKNAFRNGKGELFPYFREQGKEWRAKLFLAGFDSIEGMRDWSIESQIAVIKKSNDGFSNRRVVDSYPDWTEDQARYKNIALIQSANRAKEKELRTQLSAVGVADFTLDKVAPPCDGEKFVPLLGGEASSTNKVIMAAIAQAKINPPISLSDLGQPLAVTAQILKGEKNKFYVLVKIIGSNLSATNEISDELKLAISGMLRNGGQLGGVHKANYNIIDSETFRIAIHTRNDTTVEDVLKLSDSNLSLLAAYSFPSKL
jgi:hypothetical protein